MDSKKTSDTIKTRDINEIAQITGNIYESVVVCSKRANEISRNLKHEITEKMSQYSSTNNDNLEEYHENREQIDLSKYFEKLPKPSLIALEELVEGELYITRPEEEDSQSY